MQKGRATRDTQPETRPHVLLREEAAETHQGWREVVQCLLHLKWCFQGASTSWYRPTLLSPSRRHSNPRRQD